MISAISKFSTKGILKQPNVIKKQRGRYALSRYLR